MATTTGLYGGTRITQQTGLDQLRLWKKDQAQDLLTELRSNLNNRTGVVRLLHTSKTEKQMTFKTAGGFKQIFLNGGKLQPLIDAWQKRTGKTVIEPQTSRSSAGSTTRSGR